MSPSNPTYAPNPDEPAELSRKPTRFEIELEFVTMLTSPAYISWLAANKYLIKPEFIAYLDYLQYWSKPDYAKYLSHPGPTLRVLELLQEERFRSEALAPNVGMALAEAMMEGAARK